MTFGMVVVVCATVWMCVATVSTTIRDIERMRRDVDKPRTSQEILGTKEDER